MRGVAAALLSRDAAVAYYRPADLHLGPKPRRDLFILIRLNCPNATFQGFALITLVNILLSDLRLPSVALLWPEASDSILSSSYHDQTLGEMTCWMLLLLGGGGGTGDEKLKSIVCLPVIHPAGLEGGRSMTLVHKNSNNNNNEIYMCAVV